MDRLAPLDAAEWRVAVVQHRSARGFTVIGGMPRCCSVGAVGALAFRVQVGLVRFAREAPVGCFVMSIHGRVGPAGAPGCGLRFGFTGGLARPPLVFAARNAGGSSPGAALGLRARRCFVRFCRSLGLPPYGWLLRCAAVGAAVAGAVHGQFARRLPRSTSRGCCRDGARSLGLLVRRARRGVELRLSFPRFGVVPY